MKLQIVKLKHDHVILLTKSLMSFFLEKENIYILEQHL